jgi:two-component sensor histidine kinase/Tfp pilus assembly protein PilF
MRITHLILFILSLSTSITRGNIVSFNTKIDSLSNLINENKHDTIKVKALIDLSEILYLSDLDTVIKLSEEVISICDNNLKNDISSTEYKSFLKSKSGAYNNIGFIYDDKGDVIKALEYYHKSLSIREKLDDKLGVAVSLNNIGIIYIKQGEPEQALEYYLKSLQVKQQTGDKKSIATSLNNIAAVYKELSNPQKAIEFYTKSLLIREEIKDEKGIAVTLNNMGTLFKERGSLDTALNYYTKALKIREKIGDKRGLTNTLSNLGGVAFIKEDYPLAKKYGLEALEIANNLGYLERIKDASYLLSEVYEKQEKWKDAYKMKSLFILIKDSVRNKETELELIKQKSKYDLEKVIKEKEILTKENDIQELRYNKNRIVLAFLILAFLFTLVLVIVIYRGNRKKDLINILLKKQKEEALKQNEEKIVLLKEIHHHVKNSLQVVSSLLRLQSHEVDDEKISKMFEETQNRVLSIAKLHEQLYSSENLKEIDIKQHFLPLINDLVEEYKLGTKIKLDLDIVDVKMGAETLVPLGLIINEMISNSLKYAFKGRDKGIIKINIAKLDNGRFEMIIGDNGVGMDNDFNFEESNSLGTQLIQIFTEQLNGSIERINEKGTVFKIEFEKQEK